MCIPCFPSRLSLCRKCEVCGCYFTQLQVQVAFMIIHDCIQARLAPVNVAHEVPVCIAQACSPGTSNVIANVQPDARFCPRPVSACRRPSQDACPYTENFVPATYTGPLDAWRFCQIYILWLDVLPGHAPFACSTAKDEGAKSLLIIAPNTRSP